MLARTVVDRKREQRVHLASLRVELPRSSMTDDDIGPLDTVVSFAPGRVNLIGDHTDYTGGLALPMAIHLGTEVTWLPDASSGVVELSSSLDPEPARVPRSMNPDPLEIAMVLPAWGRFVAGVVAELRPALGGKGNVASNLPSGAGLSSSASLELALALALGHAGSPTELARICQRAEQLATGVATGILDQLTIALAEAGKAMLLDCGSLSVTHVAIPSDLELVVVHSGVERTAASGTYAARVAECARAEAELGPLPQCSPRDVDHLRDPVLRRRARHVVSENARVRAFASMLRHHDLRGAGRLMNESHRSLAMDYEVSIPQLDQLVHWLQGVDGVYGARLTGAGLGGCAIAACRPGALSRRLVGRKHWVVEPARGAHLHRA